MKLKFTDKLIQKIGKIQSEVKASEMASPVKKRGGTATPDTGTPDEQLYQLISNGKDFEIRDTEVAGLVLRVRPSGKMSYTLVYSRGKRINLGASGEIDHNQAREKAKDHLAEHRIEGVDPIEKRKREKIKAGTYLEFLDETYRPWLKANLIHGEYAYTTLKKSFPDFHKLTLEEIKPDVIENWRVSQLNRGLKPVTVNRQLSDLRACLNRAKDVWGLTTSPISKVKPSKVDKSPKVRYLTDKEETDLRRALDDREQGIKDGRARGNKWREKRNYALYNSLYGLSFIDHLKPAILVSLNTGLRRGELLKLKWEDVSFDQRSLTVVGNTSKTGKTRHIPLNDEALTTLKKWKDATTKVKSAASKVVELRQPESKDLYVFGSSTGEPLQGMKTSWEGLLIRAEISGFRWHDLRHTFASKLVMAGVDLNTVRELLGHSDYKMTLRYAHLAPKHKQEAVDKLTPVKPVTASG